MKSKIQDLRFKINAVVLSLFLVSCSLYLAPSSARADTLYNVTGSAVSANKSYTGAGTPPVYAYGFQFITGNVSAHLSSVSFPLNAVNSSDGDTIHAAIWDITSGIPSHVADSLDFYSGTSFDGDITHPAATSFSFSPAVSLDPNSIYLIAARAVNDSGSTRFVIYSSPNPSAIPASGCSSVAGRLAYIDSDGTLGLQPCDYLVEGSVNGTVDDTSPNAGHVGGNPGTVGGTGGIPTPPAIPPVNTGPSVTLPSNAPTQTDTSPQNSGSSGTLDPKVNPNLSTFKLVYCDGPAQLNTASGHQIPNPSWKDGDSPSNQYITDPSWKADPNFVTCDFNGLMLQVQHLITVMIILGIVLAVGGFAYAGGLYITGEKGKIEHAKSIFRKVFVGLIIMLSAWFIVYQIISWLSGTGSAASGLLKN